jgi:phenylpropionate dioxygenase-like ring-hydroxylating dioxygenase large terminal subunit
MSPTPMERAAAPAVEFTPIPKNRYTSSEFAAREWERLWTKVWLLAGRESDAPEPGDYFTFEIGHESILIIRQREGGLAARRNVCMHRGNRLREPGRGHATKLACAFHGWEYDIDGALSKAHDPHCFPQGLPAEELALRAVRCASWGGFVFISLNPEVEPLSEYLGVIPEHLDPYHLADWKVGFDCRIEIDCNWKTSLDAFNEAYHLAATHTWTLEFSDDVNTLYDCYDKHTRMIFPEVQASPRHPGAGTVTRGIREMFLRRVGVDVDAFRGGPGDARAAFGAAVRKMAPDLGADLSELNEAQMCDDFHYTVFPNITLNIHSLFTWVFTHLPHPEDPNKMIFDFVSLVNAPRQEIPRPDRIFLRAAEGDTLAGKCEGGELMDEDLYNLPRIQRGMRSDGFAQLHLGAQEIRILHFHDTLMRYLDGGS